MKTLIASFGLLLALALPVAGQGRCTGCKGAGAVTCSEHKRKDCELEGNAIWCSHVAGCALCGGTGYVDCERCEVPEVEARLAAKRALQAEAQKEVTRVTDALERDVRAAVSEHFTVVCELDKAKVDKRTLGGHELLHLYLDRLERLFDDYLAVLGASADEFARRPLILIWSDPLDHAFASGRFCGMTAQRGVKLMGEDPVYSVPGIKRFFTNDELLARNVIHNATHLLLSHQTPWEWIGRLKGGWADAGLAHWFEFRYWETCDNYCYQEVYTNRKLSGTKWRQRARVLVAEGAAPTLAAVVRENTETLTEEMHLVSFSLVDYLITIDGAKAGQVFADLRRKSSTRDAIERAYGWRMTQLQEDWQAWVLETYPTR